MIFPNLTIMKNGISVLLCLLLSISLFAQKSLLQSGPMNGYVTFKEAVIWVQTTESAKVTAVYWTEENPTEKLRTTPVITSKASAFAATLLADKVLPGQTYHYYLEINNVKIELDYPCKIYVPELWQWRTQPPNFSLLTGSCVYVIEKKYDRPGKPYGGDYEIFENMAKQDAKLMLWLGDNTYYREVDWDSKTGIYYRNTHTRSVSELQPLLSSMHHYAIWDDHDFGPNDAVGTFYNKDITLQAFKDFWANPNYDVSSGTGISGQFSYADIDFFLLDNRWNRTPKYDSAKTKLLGKRQITWLKSALKNSKASFKIIMVGGQFLNPVQVYENISNFPKERDAIISFIKSENIKNVVFLTGDRHHSEISKLTLNEENSIYDITSSPITSRAHKKLKEENPLRMKGSAIKERNYAKLSFSGKRGEREIRVEFYSSSNKLLFTEVIRQSK